MKGWIKVHGKSEDGRKGCTMYVRTEHIVQVSTGVLAADESKEATCIAFRGEENSLYAVTESVDEVLALIEEAEGKRSLYEKLREVQGECKRQLVADMSKQCGCETCSYFDTDESWLCDLLRREKAPCDWDLDMIPEEYR